MDYFREQITNAAHHIDRCIQHIKSDPEARLEQATNITNTLRQFSEHCSCLVFERDRHVSYDYASGQSSYEYYKKQAEKYVKAGKYSFLYSFHQTFQAMNAHRSNDDDENLRLFIDQFETLVQIKAFLLSEFGIDVLPSLDRFPLEMDETFASYYRAILSAMDDVPPNQKPELDFYYVQGQRLVYLDNREIYEITVYPVMSQRSPTNRIIVFSRTRVSPFYAVRLSLLRSEMELFDSKITLHFLSGWSVSIRPCELQGIDGLMKLASTHNRSSQGYTELMSYLTNTYSTIPDLVLLPDKEFQEVTNTIFHGNLRKAAFQTLSRLRRIVKSGRPGANVLLYLSLTMNDELIDNQRPRSVTWYPEDDIGGGIHLSKGTLFFDKRPFIGKLIKHRPPLSFLVRCFDPSLHEDELFARKLELYSNEKSRIYLDGLKGGDIALYQALTAEYNKKVEKTKTENRIDFDGDFFFLRANEESTHLILSALSALAKKTNPSYGAKASAYLSVKDIDDPNKQSFIGRCFSHSSVAFLCGRAGTGKSLALSYLCELFAGEPILVLAQTKPALDRLKRVIKGHDVTFSTVEKATYQSRTVSLLIVDESSVVSNHDLCSVLSKTQLKMAVFAGDSCQLQSIEFGNWFGLGMKVFHNCVFELTTEFRGSQYPRLKSLWSSVRDGGDIAFALRNLHASQRLSEKVFLRSSSDEVVLCLNYNGLYGINCINDYLQSANPKPSFEINHRVFKEDDPILFIDSARFGAVLHNNLKGRIKSITPFSGGLSFRLLVDTDLRFCQISSLIFHGYKDGVSDITIDIYSSGGSDDKKRRQDCVVPFQLAYAVSIHKAQGLEYDSVKVVIANDVEERITSNVFYTAITRAKHNLTIFWTPESEHKILQNMKRTTLSDDYKIYFKRHPMQTYNS